MLAEGMMRRGLPIAAGFTLLAFASLSPSDPILLHPVERHLRDDFPSLSVHTSATFESVQEIVGESVVAGLRAHLAQASAAPTRLAGPAAMPAPSRGGAEPALQVTYPRLYGDPLVATLGAQRVVLRAMDARAAAAEVSTGKLIYQDAYASVDAVEVPGGERDEELLLLRDEGAPLVYDYEIVDMHGVGAVVLDDGAVRFAPDATAIVNPANIVLQIDRPWVIDATGRRSEGHGRWTILRDNATPTILRLTVSSQGLSYPLLVDPSFSATGNLIAARLDHTATLLSTGKVLIAGGAGTSGAVSSAELFDPATAKFGATGSPTIARIGPAATLVPNGKVLLVGGLSGSSGTQYFSSAELYDPATGAFVSTGSLITGRAYPTTTRLADGRVLVAGGFGDSGLLSSAELCDPETGSFSATGSLNKVRYRHTATLLGSGKVLMVGGDNDDQRSAELYDPANGMFSQTGSLAVGRVQHTATRLAGGKVLVVGGLASPSSLSSAELYDPEAGTFDGTGSLAVGRALHTATLLTNGTVLVAGGMSGGGTTTNSAELFDPATGTFTGTASLIVNDASSTATLLPSGDVLLAAGSRNGSAKFDAEVYSFASGTFSPTGSLATARSGAATTLLPEGKVLLAGGFIPGGALSSAEVYDPATGTFNATGNLVAARWGASATLLLNGKALIAGGSNGSVYLSAAELMIHPAVRSLRQEAC